MANSAIALLAKSLPSASAKSAADTSAKTNADPSPRATGQGGDEDLGAGNQFSLVFNQANSDPAALGFGFTIDPLDSMPSSDVLMPEPIQQAAYQLLSAGGKDLPFLGNYMPGVVIQNDFTGTPLKALATESNPRLININSESSNKSVASISQRSSIEEDIALWLGDPDLAFVSADAGSAQVATGEISSKGSEFANGPNLAKPIDGGSGNTRQNTTTLSLALTELSARMQSESAEREGLPLAGEDEIVDSVKSAMSSAKQGEVGPMQLFDQLKLENRLGANMKDRKFSLRGVQTSTNGNLLNSDTAGGAELNDRAVAKTIGSSPMQLGNAANSVDSFASVLLNIDTQGQASPSINTALDQWKAEQATRTVEQERTDGTNKNFVARVSLPFTQSGWGEKLGKQLSMMMARNLDSAQIQIDPPELGSLQVKIQVINDQVSLQFITGHGMVREALEGASARLQEMFKGEGMELASLDIANEETAQQQAKDSHPRELDLIQRSGNNTGNADQEESDGLLTLATQWQQDDGKIDYFI